MQRPPTSGPCSSSTCPPVAPPSFPRDTPARTLHLPSAPGPPGPVPPPHPHIPLYCLCSLCPTPNTQHFPKIRNSKSGASHCKRVYHPIIQLPRFVQPLDCFFFSLCGIFLFFFFPYRTTKQIPFSRKAEKPPGCDNGKHQGALHFLCKTRGL